MTAKRLSTRRHAVYRLAPDLLLVFKPRGHREAAHAHAHAQRVRVLRGALRVGVGLRSITLRPSSRPFSIPAGRLHETVAAQDTWLIAETTVVIGRREDARAGA
jgi:quercetin dioxygenase-like cupin family protein